MTFTDLCNEIKKLGMVNGVLTVLFIIMVPVMLIGGFGSLIRDEHGRDVMQRNENLMLENICIAQETAEIIQEKDEKTARIITVMLNEYLKGVSWAKTAE